MKASQPKYFHRDLSWLLFNRRVIMESYAPDNPVLEQLRFLAIASNNLDEFFMVRIPQIQTLARMPEQSVDRKTHLPQQEILHQASTFNRKNIELQYARFEELRKKLHKKELFLKSFDELSVREKNQTKRYFKEVIFPTLAPIGLDAYHAFPRLQEKALHIWCRIRDDERGESYQAIVPISKRLSRLYRLSARRFILLEEIVEHFLDYLFEGLAIEERFVFRVTYDHDLEFREDNEEDLYNQMAEYLAERAKGLPSRLEIQADSPLSASGLGFLRQHLELQKDDIYTFKEPLDLTFLFEFVDLIKDKLPKAALYPPLKAKFEKKWHKKRILQTMEQEDLLLQHPYDSFKGVLAFLEAAVDDPNTIAIKQTLYRLAEHSKVIALLKRAAQKGIQVTVLVEIKARFDEEQNLHWVNELEDAGCFVSYGFPNLKAHSKALLVIQKSGEKIKRFAQIGTGNYNEKNSRIYTDLSFFTTKAAYVDDLTDFFNYVCGYRNRPSYQKIATSPNGIQQMIIEKTRRLIALQKKNGDGRIFAKMNGLTDTRLIDQMYEASQAGIKIFLQVRGSCCLVPGVEGLSENITVSSIVGRFLEHSRIYLFETGGTKEWWISSADWMTRNMRYRVELAAPLAGTTVERKIDRIAEVFQADDAKAYFLAPDGSYQRKTAINHISAQRVFAGMQPYRAQKTD